MIFYEVTISNRHVDTALFFMERPTTDTLVDLLLFWGESSCLTPILRLDKSFPYLTFADSSETIFIKHIYSHSFSTPKNVIRHLTNKNSGIREVAKGYLREN